MNIKKIAVLFCFCLLNFLSKSVCQSRQGYLMIDNDTFLMSKKLINYDRKITSVTRKMAVSDCISMWTWPTWVIENDSLFLKKLKLTLTLYGQDSIADLAKDFKKNYVKNGRVFAKKVNYEILARRINPFFKGSTLYQSEIFSFIKIRNGKVIHHAAIIDTTEWMGRIDSDVYPTPEQIEQSQKNYELYYGEYKQAIVKIKMNDNLRAVEIKVVEGSNKFWDKRIFKMIKQLPEDHSFFYDALTGNPRETLKFVFKKPH